jgi:hypothetical protein
MTMNFLKELVLLILLLFNYNFYVRSIVQQTCSYVQICIEIFFRLPNITKICTTGLDTSVSFIYLKIMVTTY